MKSLLVVAPFWNPECPPLGICSLQAFLKERGRDVAIFDYNTDRDIWGLDRRYLEHLVAILPDARGWNILRTGPDYLMRHQMAWLRIRNEPRRYAELTQLILNIDGRHELDPAQFDEFDRIFEKFYARIDTLTDALLSEHKPDLFGCTLLTTTLPASLHILQRAKEFNPEIRTVLGGPGPVFGAGADSPDTQGLLEHCPWIDNIVIGEGELLLDALQADRLPRRKLFSLKDVATLDVDPGVGKPEKRGLISDLSTLPTPDYTGLETGRYRSLSVGVTRGCAYRCSFCYETTYWKRYRKRPMDTALRDLQTLSERHKRNDFFLCDSLCNLFAEDLSTGILDRGLDAKWDAFLRADKPLLDRNYVKHLADGGMKRARLGLESADDDTLDMMNKQTSVDNLPAILENLAAAGIETYTFWLVGFPGEDERAFQTSLDFLRECKDSIYCADPAPFMFHPTTGTEPVFGRLVASESFEAQYGMHRRYPEEFDDALLVTYFELDIPDIVAMRTDRLERMCAVMEEAGIPRVYTMLDWRRADLRWKDLRQRRTPVSSKAVSTNQGEESVSP